MLWLKFSFLAKNFQIKILDWIVLNNEMNPFELKKKKFMASEKIEMSIFFFQMKKRENLDEPSWAKLSQKLTSETTSLFFSPRLINFLSNAPLGWQRDLNTLYYLFDAWLSFQNRNLTFLLANSSRNKIVSAKITYWDNYRL